MREGGAWVNSTLFKYPYPFTWFGSIKLTGGFVGTFIHWLSQSIMTDNLRINDFDNITGSLIIAKDDYVRRVKDDDGHHLKGLPICQICEYQRFPCRAKAQQNEVSIAHVMIFLPSAYVRIVTIREKEGCLPRLRYFYFMIITYCPCEGLLGTYALVAMVVFISLIAPPVYTNVDVVIVGVPMEVRHLGHPFEIVAHLRHGIPRILGKLVLDEFLDLARWNSMVHGELDVGSKLRILGEKTTVIPAVLNLFLFTDECGYKCALDRFFVIIKLLIINYFSLIINYK